jgi:hypothetical protein
MCLQIEYVCRLNMFAAVIYYSQCFKGFLALCVMRLVRFNNYMKYHCLVLPRASNKKVSTYTNVDCIMKFTTFVVCYCSFSLIIVA